jgi:electron transport complex protein RnfC
VATGSPILGRVVQNLDEPVIKTTYAVFALLDVGGGHSRNCISCGECREVCPMQLDPEELFKAAKIARTAEAVSSAISQTFGSAQSAAVADWASLASQCHGCGCCDVVCPSRLSLSAEIGNLAADRRVAERRAADQKAVDQKAADRRLAERRAANQWQIPGGAF